MRRIVWVLAAVVTLLGLGCLNYTVDGKAPDHREWARERGLPEPGEGIFLLGIGSSVVGAATLGYLLGRRPVRR